MKDLDLNNWLRYFLSGAIIITILLWISNDGSTNVQDLKDFLKNFSNFEKGILGVSTALIIGATIYSLHRAIIYPLIYYVIQIFFNIALKAKRKSFKSDTLWPFRPSKQELEEIKKHWGASPEIKKIYDRLSEWAGQIHFLYCTSWSLLLVKVMICQLNINGYSWLMPAFWAIFIAAIISHLRYWYVQIRVTN